MLETRCFYGAEVAQVIPALAALRIAVFRDWPYLYAGDTAYEEAYLKGYTHTDALVCAVFDGEICVGAATGMPLIHHGDARQINGSFDVDGVFYCAESVLMPEYRGRGLGHVFFDERERHARDLGCHTAAFCAVDRPTDHPRRPEDYRPLHGFWRKRGYAPVPGVSATFSWQDIGEADETPKTLQYWARSL